MEQFYSIQGEGHYQGHAAYFIRLGGCDVGCTWCDVKESWDAASHPLVPLHDMVGPACDSGSKIVVVTGGEPVQYDLTALTALLKSAGLRTHLETSGIHELTGVWDWVCLSPKKFVPPKESVVRVTDELKVIVYHRTDLEWAQRYAEKTKPGCEWFLQPEWSREKEMLPLIIDYVKAHPEWKVSLQVHKYMQIP